LPDLASLSIEKKGAMFVVQRREKSVWLKKGEESPCNQRRSPSEGAKAAPPSMMTSFEYQNIGYIKSLDSHHMPV